MAKERSIRVGAAGIIIQDDKILLVKFDDENGPHYNYPGGGHQEGETLRQTAGREVKEETDADVEVGRLLVTTESAPQEVEYIYGSTHFLKLFLSANSNRALYQDFLMYPTHTKWRSNGSPSTNSHPRP